LGPELESEYGVLHFLTLESESESGVAQKQGLRIPAAETARVGGRYAVQGHSRSLMLVPIESPYVTSY